MAIKFNDIPKDLEFIWEGKEGEEICITFQDDGANKIISAEYLKGHLKKSGRNFYFPASFFCEVVDFLREKGCLDSSSFKEERKVISSEFHKLTMPEVIDSGGKIEDSENVFEGVRKIEVNEEDAIEDLSFLDKSNIILKGDVIVDGREEIEESNTKKEKIVANPNEEIKKRGVLSGNMPAEQAALIRGKGKAGSEKLIKRTDG